MRCESCDEPISEKRMQLIPLVRLCTDCQSEEDVFKYKMKVVGFDDIPKIAKNKEDWELLRKQKQLRDI